MEKPSQELLTAVQHLANAQALFMDMCHINKCKEDIYSEERVKFINKYKEYLPIPKSEMINS